MSLLFVDLARPPGRPVRLLDIDIFVQFLCWQFLQLLNSGQCYRRRDQLWQDDALGFFEWLLVRRCELFGVLVDLVWYVIHDAFLTVNLLLATSTLHTWSKRLLLDMIYLLEVFRDGRRCLLRRCLLLWLLLLLWLWFCRQWKWLFDVESTISFQYFFSSYLLLEGAPDLLTGLLILLLLFLKCALLFFIFLKVHLLLLLLLFHWVNEVGLLLVCFVNRIIIGR